MSSFSLQVVLLGAHGSGKSCLLHRYITGEWDDRIRATYGTAFAARAISLPDGRRIAAGFWDTSGSPAFHGLSRRFIRGADVAICCFDLTSRTSWERLKVWIREAREEQPDIRILIAACKDDLVRHPPPPDRTTRAGLLARAAPGRPAPARPDLARPSVDGGAPAPAATTRLSPQVGVASQEPPTALAPVRVKKPAGACAGDVAGRSSVAERRAAAAVAHDGRADASRAAEAAEASALPPADVSATVPEPSATPPSLPDGRSPQASSTPLPATPPAGLAPEGHSRDSSGSSGAPQPATPPRGPSKGAPNSAPERQLDSPLCLERTNGEAVAEPNGVAACANGAAEPNGVAACANGAAEPNGVAACANGAAEPNGVALGCEGVPADEPGAPPRAAADGPAHPSLPSSPPSSSLERSLDLPDGVPRSVDSGSRGARTAGARSEASSDVLPAAGRDGSGRGRDESASSSPDLPSASDPPAISAATDCPAAPAQAGFAFPPAPPGGTTPAVPGHQGAGGLGDADEEEAAEHEAGAARGGADGLDVADAPVAASPASALAPGASSDPVPVPAPAATFAPAADPAPAQQPHRVGFAVATLPASPPLPPPAVSLTELAQYATGHDAAWFCVSARLGRGVGALFCAAAAHASGTGRLPERESSHPVLQGLLGLSDDGGSVGTGGRTPPPATPAGGGAAGRAAADAWEHDALVAHAAATQHKAGKGCLVS